MPWQMDGTFLRSNGQFDGSTVWDQDRQAGYKIIATRHDSHDEDIADGIEKCLNIQGYNSPLANINWGGFKITNMADGAASGDAVNKSQLDAVQADVDANTAAIATIQTANPDNIITAMSWDGATLTATRSSGNFTVSIAKLNSIKSNGPIRHKGADLTAAASVTLNPANGNRFYMLNNTGAGVAITITKPTGNDSDLGANYFVEGSVIIENGATPGTVSLAGVSGADVIGSPDTSINAKFLLTYMIQHKTGDTYEELYVWSKA